MRAAARAGDMDRYLAALLAPRRARADLMALTAFLGEVARIPRLVKEPTMGEIRLQWWREALDALRAGRTTGNPVADALGAAIARHRLPDALLHSVIDAVSDDLAREALAADGHERIPELASYIDRTDGAAFKLAARVLNVTEDDALSELLSAAAQAYGRVRLLRSLRLTEAGAADLRRDARAWLAQTRLLVKAAPEGVLPAILPVALVEPYLGVLERQDGNSANSRADISQLARVWALWRASVLGRV